MQQSNPSSSFAGDKKVGGSLFFNLENRLVARTIDYLPLWLETYHLTFLTILWSLLVLVAGYFARLNLNWLWFFSVAVFFQYLTDLYDGKIGKHRGTGLIKWGYYMDHFLDYIFLCAMMIGYIFFFPEEQRLELIFQLAVFVGFMVNSYLFFSATNRFKIDFFRFGPTEFRLFVIIFNILLIYFGVGWAVKLMPFFLLFSFSVLILSVYRAHQEIWQLDMDLKKINSGQNN